MKKPETAFKEWFVARLETIPKIWVEKIQQVAIRGTPDLIVCLRGIFIAIELKIGDEEPDDLQAYKLNAIKRAGGVTYVVRPTNAEEVLRNLRKGVLL